MKTNLRGTPCEPQYRQLPLVRLPSPLTPLCGSSVEMCTSRTGGGEAITDSELEESFDDEEHDSADGTESRIAQYITRSASALTAIGCCTETT
jgi:hypothetical protein